MPQKLKVVTSKKQESSNEEIEEDIDEEEDEEDEDIKNLKMMYRDS